jgi:hypothetical protein
MHSRLCMYEHFDLIIDLFKYKHETCQVFKHPFQEIVMINAKCKSWMMDSIGSKWTWFNSCTTLVVEKMFKKY